MLNSVSWALGCANMAASMAFCVFKVTLNNLSWFNSGMLRVRLLGDNIAKKLRNGPQETTKLTTNQALVIHQISALGFLILAT